MKKSFIPILLLSIILITDYQFCYSSSSQVPEWINAEFRKNNYPDSDYLTGFCSQKNYRKQDETELSRQLLDYAKQLLIESVSVNIQVISISQTEAIETQKKVSVSDYLKTCVSSNSNLSITGLKTKVYYSRKEKMGYAFAYVNKPEVEKNYQWKIKELVLKATSISSSFEDLPLIDLQKRINEIQQIILKLENYQSILVGIGVIDPEILQTDKTMQIRKLCDANQQRLKKNKFQSIQELAFFLIHDLKDNYPQDSLIVFNDITFEQTGIGSEFSFKLKETLKQEAILQQLKIAAIESPENENAFYSLSGKYWEDKEYLKIMVLLSDPWNNAVIACAKVQITKKACQNNNISYLPSNIQKALNRQVLFMENPLIPNNLNIDIWTNRGKNNLIFREGDTLQLFVQANKECYLRFIYYLADGTKVLLLDNYLIEEEFAERPL